MDVTFELYEIDRPYQSEPLLVATATGSHDAAWREINHYAMVYGQDGPVEIRTPIEGDS